MAKAPGYGPTEPPLIHPALPSALMFTDPGVCHLGSELGLHPEALERCGLLLRLAGTRERTSGGQSFQVMRVERAP